jgi:hypothetical protein
MDELFVAGSYGDDGSTESVSYRDDNLPDLSDYNISSRPTLYVK